MERPTTMPPFFITTSWDDGSAHDARLADLLLKYRLPATFYIAKHSEFRGLSDNEIRKLGLSFELGAHTLNHVRLSSVSEDVARAEIQGSKHWIEEVSGRSCRVFCFPGGRFRASQLMLVSAAGLLGVRTVELMSVKFPGFVSGVGILDTTIQAFPHTSTAYVKNICRRLAAQNLWNYAAHGRKSNWLLAAKSLFNYVSLNGGVFHLWGHSWELEEYGLWSELEDCFQFIAEQDCTRLCRTNSELCLLGRDPTSLTTPFRS